MSTTAMGEVTEDQTLRTRSGSVYRVRGGTVERVGGDRGEPGVLYTLISLGGRLRYTDGRVIFTSSEVVSAS